MLVVILWPAAAVGTLVCPTNVSFPNFPQEERLMESCLWKPCKDWRAQGVSYSRYFDLFPQLLVMLLEDDPHLVAFYWDFLSWRKLPCQDNWNPLTNQHGSIKVQSQCHHSRQLREAVLAAQLHMGSAEVLGGLHCSSTSPSAPSYFITLFHKCWSSLSKLAIP